MPHYHKAGQIPHKRHTQFRKPDGSLYSEELFSTEGFSSDSSLLYHLYPPTRMTGSFPSQTAHPQVVQERILKPRSFEGFKIESTEDYVDARIPLFINGDLQISVAAPEKGTEKYFWKNADADELIFVHEGRGKVTTPYGSLYFKYGDYLVLPRGTVYQITFEHPANHLFIIESYSPLRFPKKYKGANGQLLEHAPFCERDIRQPENLETHDETGDYVIKLKKGNSIFTLVYAHHPFDVIGWDGYCYPYALSIHDFEPITGRVHQPPPVHQTFEGNNFVVCSFVPRLFDYHPEAIPAPYNHSNIDSDELLYYVDGNFMSRKDVSRGMITLHPAGIPHGPHPGAVEKSIGAKETSELAVMVDTFHPLKLTEAAMKIENQDYLLSWLK